ncbi:MAG TPA: Ig domain-containing protein [Spirochaetota bacterium]|nr:Ig domain-containing protein [Spirochaetota bacterium]HPI87976.1 Ig domain-containing protein [Spirochaetota bacterium]HPR46687.1 Ig domain-containing protein [Spirochaetota bacterium]
MKTKLSYLALCLFLIASVFSVAGCDEGPTENNQNPPSAFSSVTGVSLNNASTSIAIGYTEQLVATITPENASNKNVTWSSDDSGVASVTDGLVTGVSEGSTTIYVTTDDGDYSAECDVTVTQPIAVTGVSLNTTSASIAISDTEQLVATITPGNASNKSVTWSSDDPDIASVTDGGLVTGVSEGTTTIYVTTVDGGFSAECDVTVSPAVETTWVYDFMAEGDQDVYGTDWFYSEDGSNPRAQETGNGYYMNMTSIAAPCLFTGDFTVEFDFYLKFVDDDYIYRYAFRLVDPNWENNSSRRYFDFSAEYTKFPVHEWAFYTLAQGNGSYSYTDYNGNVPGVQSGLNTCTIEKEGSTITVSMNGTFVRSATISSSNEPSIGYAPFIHGHNSWIESESNFYLRKVTVTYMSNERVYHNWNE